MNKYAFGDLIPLFNGVPLTGFAEGDDVISVKKRVDTFSDKVGADGQMTVVKSSDKSGEIIMKFMQGSAGSAALDGFYAKQNVRGAFLPGAFVLYNPTTLEEVIAAACYIKKTADMTRGAGLNSEEWAIVCEDLYLFRSAVGAFGAAVNGIAGGVPVFN